MRRRRMRTALKRESEERDHDEIWQNEHEDDAGEDDDADELRLRLHQDDLSRQQKTE